MSIFQRNILGTILKPDGTPVDGGQIEFTLSTGTGTVPDDTTSDEYSVGGPVTIPIGADGTVNFNLVPNDKITPAGTVWIARFQLAGGFVYEEKWSVTDSGSPIQIGDVIRSNIGAIVGGQGFLIVSTFADLPAPSSSVRGIRGYVEGGTLVADAEYVCMKDDLDVYNWVLDLAG